jgi:hypothetical protein
LAHKKTCAIWVSQKSIKSTLMMVVIGVTLAQGSEPAWPRWTLAYEAQRKQSRRNSAKMRKLKMQSDFQNYPQITQPEHRIVTKQGHHILAEN